MFKKEKGRLLFLLIIIFILSNCEVPHSSSDEGIAICNIYDETNHQIILCPELGDLSISVGDIPLQEVLIVKFLNNQERTILEFGNSLLQIGALQSDENNYSWVEIYPKIAGTTILRVDDLNLTLNIQ